MPSSNSLRRRCGRVVIVVLFVSASVKAAPVDFVREVAPIFEASCVRCHDAEHKKGKYSLATAKDALAKRRGEEDAIVPGDPDGSLLLEQIAPHGDDKPEMPKEAKPLTAEQVAVVRRWIAEGAHWPEGIELKQRAKADKSWWSLQPLAPLKGGATIDDFIAAKLAEKGLAMNPPAEPRDLIRRATYDLTGLPPTPEEVQAFVDASHGSNESNRTYENLVDRLLASPRYGEHWGRHWLDVVRFGESSGFERNLIRDNAWPFRDYVIRSINDDKPFDRFIVEHLAGDQLAPDDPQVAVGVGFLVAGPYDDVGNKDAKAAAQIRANTLDDIVATTGSAFLGLTIGCARCHDHKFDPVPQADYYRLQAVFAGVQQGAGTLASAEEKRELAGRRKPLEVALAEVKRERQELRAEAAPRLSADREALLAEHFSRPALASNRGEEVFREPIEARWVRFTFAPVEGGKGMVLLQECELWTGDASVALASAGGKATARKTRAEGNGDTTIYGPQKLIDGDLKTTWHSGEPGGQFTIELSRPERLVRAVWIGAGVSKAEEYTIEVSLDGKRWTRAASNEGRRPAAPEKLEDALTRFALPEEKAARWTELSASEAKLEAEVAALPKLPTAWIGSYRQPSAATYLMKGGDPQKNGGEIAPGSLAVLDHCTAKYEQPLDAPEGGRRLALAKWLVADDNPITPRVLANRVWHYHFGTGIVDTPSDFGYMGGRPTHPELLDYLAARLKANGWRLKALHREIMLSAAYRQASSWNSESDAVDHDSRLLWRFPPRRLSAEELRDTMLAVAGVLDLSQDHGPGFRLYRYLNDNVSTYVPLDEHDAATYRRAVFHQNARAATVDLMSDFDAPDCAFTTPRRTSTTTPLQALTLFNHRFTIDMARALAARLERENADDLHAQMRRAFALATAQPPSAAEESAAADVVANFGLPAFCRALLNSNGLLYIP